ncbi:hypothetical protein C8250_020745 [Streptomyces sp. So13.3]|uniref:hypothetical protein n=1 Tax=Streptomyces TaxID=1883 RepID=UPI001107275A|nr:MULTISPECIES: hypothetical protein [Streptomyces]MCZ4099514.1 hypothetical protein [Streptomyces sp. H39-C1]QNA74024.1 hypothetical protein C8250_020745 [Streptomyces sp. So13.3]
MDLQFIGMDPETDTDHCPTVWVDAEGGDLVLQGWKADDATEAKCQETGSLPDYEAVIRIPARMVPLLRRACDDAERSALR